MLKNEFKFIQLVLLAVMSLSMTSIFSGEKNTLELGSFANEILAKVESINPTNPVTVEVMNLDYGGNTEIVELKFCDVKDDPISIFTMEQTMKLLWHSQEKGKLIRISYIGQFDRCIKKVKISTMKVN